MNTETLFRWRKLTVSSRPLLLTAHEGALSDGDLNHNRSILFESPWTEGQKDLQAGHHWLVSATDEFCSASPQISATCPCVPPAGTWSALCAGSWMPYKSVIKLSCKKLSHSDISLTIMKKKLPPSIWKRPWEVYLKLPIMGFCDCLNLQWNSDLSAACATSTKRAYKELLSLKQ